MGIEAKVARIKCKGKVRLVEENSVRVSLFMGEDKEVVGNMDRSYFRPNIQVGDMFYYDSRKKDVKITYVPKKEITKKQLNDIRKEVEKELPKDEY